MKKESIIILVLLLAILPLSLVSSLEIEKVDKGSVVIAELDNPAIFDFMVSNNGSAERFEIYSFAGVSFSPRGFFDLPSGKSTLEVKAYPNKDIRKQRGLYNFEYQIKGQTSGIFKDTLSITIVELKDSLEVSAKPLNYGDSEAIIYIKNIQKTNLDNVKVKLSSEFFSAEKLISLKPYERIEVSVPVKKDELKTLSAGSYIFNAEISLENANTKINGVINYLEKENIVLNKHSSGFIVRKTIYNKTNEGNVPTVATIEFSKDIISRLFTINAIEPLEVKRHGLYTKYSWEKEIKPGESFVISSTTNYTLPFILILLIVIIALLVKVYIRTNLILNKRVSFVRTKGGELALKVRLHVKARNYVENIQVIDRLPGMTQLYEKFGIKPDRIDSATKRLFWNIERLNAGEERVFSYIVYSKVNVVGRFELPSATAIYQRNGKTEEAFSNRTFFVSETAKFKE